MSSSLNAIGQKLRNILDRKFLIEIGKISYGIYIIHWPLKHILLKSDILRFLHSSLLINTSILLISIGLSFALFHLFEIKFLKLKKRFVPREGEK